MDRPPPIAYAGRIERVRAEAIERGFDGLLVTDLINVRWLTGFTGSAATVVITPDAATLVTDGRYGERATSELGAAGVAADVRVGLSQAEQTTLVAAAAAGLHRIGAEASTLSYEKWLSLREHLAIEPAGTLVGAGRRVKDAGEIARIAEAARCADAALAEVAPLLGDGMTEADVRNELEYRMRLHGADGPSYATIVAAGPEHAARPHHNPTTRRIVEGDTVVIDVGGLVDGYHSDMTRSFVIGEPTSLQREVYALLLDVQAAGIAAVTSGAAATDVDTACRSMVTSAGYGEWFLHSTGHGVGLQIHEDPFESPVSKQTLVAGDVVTVEPGLYRVGFGGFRIEDLLEVTESGCRILTQSPKDTPCLPSPPTI